MHFPDKQSYKQKIDKYELAREELASTELSPLIRTLSINKLTPVHTK